MSLRQHNSQTAQPSAEGGVCLQPPSASCLSPFLFHLFLGLGLQGAVARGTVTLRPGQGFRPPTPDPSDCVTSLGNLAVRHSPLWIASQLGPDISDSTATEQFTQQSPVAGPATSRQHLAKMRMSGTASIRAVGRALLPAREETRGSATAKGVALLPSLPAHCQALQGLHFVPGQDVPLTPLPPQVTGWVSPYPPIHPSAWDHQ